MKCPKCKGYGYYEKEEDGIIELIKCECQYTNEEWLRSASTEQLADVLCDVWYGIDDVINIMAEDGEISKKDAMKLWLKQPHVEKER